MSYENIPKNLTEKALLVRGGRPDYTILSTAAFPAPTLDEAGAILEFSDTGDRYRWTGTVWVQDNAPKDYKIEVAKSRIGGTTGIALVMRNPLCSDSAFTDLWGGGGATHDNFILPTAAVALEVVSNNAADTLTTGAGAWTILINTLDVNYDVQIPEVVNLNGTSAVAIPGTHFRPHHLTATRGAFILAADQTTVHQSNTGTITISEVVSGNIWMVIQPNFGISEDSNFTVPAGFTIFARKAIITWAKDQSGDILGSIKPFGTDTARISSGKLSVDSNGLILDFQVLFPAAEKTDLTVRAKSTNLDVELTFIQEFELVDNNFI